MGKLRPLKLLNTAYWTCQNNINKSVHLFTSHWHSVHTSGSQTCSNRYPNQGSDSVLLSSIKIFRISGRKFLLQWSLIIPSNIVILVPRYPSKNRILPLGGNLPSVWEPLVYANNSSIPWFDGLSNFRTACGPRVKKSPPTGSSNYS